MIRFEAERKIADELAAAQKAVAEAEAAEAETLEASRHMSEERAMGRATLGDQVKATKAHGRAVDATEDAKARLRALNREARATREEFDRADRDRANRARAVRRDQVELAAVRRKELFAAIFELLDELEGLPGPAISSAGAVLTAAVSNLRRLERLFS